MRKLHYFFFCILGLLSVKTWTQEPVEKYQFVNIKESISKVGVYNITQDNYGFIWLGTNGAGLNKFDGIDYTSYKNDLNNSTSLSNNTVFCSFIDNKNRLWFGTDVGISLYDRKNDRFKRISLSEFKENKTNVSVKSLVGDGRGNLFIGTFELGLFKLNLETFEVEKVLNQEFGVATPVTVNFLVKGANEKIYAGTDKGLKEFDAKTNTLKFSVFLGENGAKVLEEPIQYLLVQENNLWVGTTTNGLFKINTINQDNKPIKLEHFLISENRILSMINLPDGTLMCGIENDGLFHLNADGSIIHHYLYSKTDTKGIMSNSIWSLFLDKNKRIWIGYFNAGMGIYDNLYDKFKNIESLQENSNSLQIGSVTAIVKDNNDNLWLSMDGGGIDVLNTKTNKFTHINKAESKVYSGLTDDYIVSLFIDSKENIWVGSWSKGLFLLKKGAKKFINYTIKKTEGLKSNNILNITEGLDGTIWFASWKSGLHSYSPETDEFSYYTSEPFLKNGIPNCYARKVLVDKKGNLWLATTNKGLFKIVKLKDGTFSVESMAFRMSEELNNYGTANHILSLFESKDGCIWIGTRGAGLCKYNSSTNTFTWYNKLNGLNAINIVGIMEDLEENIWLSSNSGLTKFNVKANKYTVFNKNDGLLSNDFNINSTFRDELGNIYFGNYLGVDYFNPSNISVNTIEPSLYLTDFKLFNKTVVPNAKDSPLQSVIGETSSIVLNSSQSVFTIEYTGVNYTRPEKNKYAYYLEGLEETWNYVDNKRSATYTNLSQGNYTFKLKSANSDGVWNTTPIELKITVLPPWWKTNQALFVYVAILLLGIYYLNSLTQKRIKVKQEEELKQNKMLQEKALNEEKFQFFTNISHEFRTPLSLIMNPIDDIIRDETLNLPLNVREKHKTVYKNTNRLYRLINELLDFRKLELNKVNVRANEINLVPFAKYVISYFKEEASNKNLDLNIDADFSTIPIWADQNMLEKIIFNILSNAIKITPKGGTINVDIISQDKLYLLPLVNKNKPVKVIQINISDTGEGIAKEDLEKIFERFYQSNSLNKGYYGGTGIGLEVVRKFVSLHKGKIEVESVLGEGTTFKIILPAGKDHFTEKEISKNSREETKQELSYVPEIAEITYEDIDADESIKRNTILIVEDNEELRNYIKQEIEKEYKVFTANNGKEGLKLVKKLLPDIIITDVVMPEMDGLEFCKRIKSDISSSHIPILMLTAKDKIDDRMEGIEKGADAYMIKPFNIRLLKLRLSQLITSRQLIFNKYFSVLSEVPADTQTSSLDKEFIEKVLNYINKNISNPELNVETLASELNLSRSQFYRKIKALTSQTANEFLRNIRLQKAKQILEMGETNISKVCYAIGFSSPSYFTKCFKNQFKILPTEVILTTKK